MTKELTAEELRERGLRDSPVVDVEDAFKRVWPDGGDLAGDMRQALDRVKEGAAYQYAMICGGAAAQLIREAFGENAHRALFERGETADDSGTYTNLLVVLDAAGEVLWYDRENEELSDTPFGRRVDEIEAHGGQVIPDLSEDTKKAIEALVELAEDTTNDGYLVRGVLRAGRFTEAGEAVDADYDADGDDPLEMDIPEEIGHLHRFGGDPATDGSQFPQRRLLKPLERDVTVRVLNDVLAAGVLPKVRLFHGDRGLLANVVEVLDPRQGDGDRDPGRYGYISLLRLADVLGQETSVLDPDDVPALMEVIRKAADGPAEQGVTVVGEADGDEAAVQRLVQLARELRVDCDVLDGLVHEMHSLPASEVNNSGFEEQIRYLLPLMREAELEHALRAG